MDCKVGCPTRSWKQGRVSNKVTEAVSKVNPVDVHLVMFMYLVFTHMPVESCRLQLRSLLLCLCDIF